MLTTNDGDVKADNEERAPAVAVPLTAGLGYPPAAQPELRRPDIRFYSHKSDVFNLDWVDNQRLVR